MKLFDKLFGGKIRIAENVDVSDLHHAIDEVNLVNTCESMGSDASRYISYDRTPLYSVVVYDGKSPIGWGVVWENLVSHLMVLPEFRNRGIGTKIVDRMRSYSDFLEPEFCPWDRTSREFFRGRQDSDPTIKFNHRYSL